MNLDETCKARVPFVDWMRGCAAFLVLIQHSFENVSKGFYTWSTQYLSCGMMGVVVFFLISGFVIAHSAHRKPAFIFLIHRFFRIFPLYWTILFLGISTHIYENKSLDLTTLLFNILLLQDYVGFYSHVGGSWTLLLELVFYILFIIRNKNDFFRNHFSAFYLLFSSMLILIFLRYFLDLKIPLGRPLLIFSAFQATLWYERNYSPHAQKNKEWQVTFFLLMIAIMYYISLNENPVFHPLCILFSWTAAYLLFFLFPKIQLGEKMSHILAWMGKVSYSVYLGQGLLLMWMSRLNVPSFFYLTAIPLTYLCAALLHKFIELPGISWGRAISKSRFLIRDR